MRMGGKVTIPYSTTQRERSRSSNDGQRAKDPGCIFTINLADWNPGWWRWFGTSCWSLTVRSLECEGPQVSGPASHGTFSSPTHQPNLIIRHLSINRQQFRVRHGPYSTVTCQLAVRQDRVRISAQHPRGGPLPSGSYEENSTDTRRVMYCI